MATLPELADRLRALVEESQQRSQSRRHGLSKEMAESDRRDQRFSEIARRCLDETVLPRLETLASIFPNAGPIERSGDAVSARVTFRSTARFPIGADIFVHLGHDSRIREMLVDWKVEIMPILFNYERESSHRESLDAYDPARVGHFLEERLLQFTRDYLRVHEPGSPYMESALAVDPVCGMRFSPSEAACIVEHDSRTYYFCAESCRDKFRAGIG